MNNPEQQNASGRVKQIICCALAILLGCLLGSFLRKSFYLSNDGEIHPVLSGRTSPANNKSITALEEKDQEGAFTEKELEPFEEDSDLPLIKRQYGLTGATLTKLIPETLADDCTLSESMASLMGLTPEEKGKADAQLKAAMAKLREIEKQNFQVTQDRGEIVSIVVPAFAEQGAMIRSELMRSIGRILGPRRKALFELQLLQAPTRLGNFGQEEMVLRYPEAAYDDGNSIENVSLQMGQVMNRGTEEEFFEGHEKRFSSAAFDERFGHLLHEEK